MDAFSDRRLAENEVILRQLNSEAKDFVLEDAPDTVYANRPLQFYCECSNMDCRERIQITAKKYDELHGEHDLFITKPGHELPEIEEVIQQDKDYEIVRKFKVPPVPKEINPKKIFGNDSQEYLAEV